ncbi:MAG: SUF system NifU family Fe-S cluster assembly protein [Actinomycetaceae bacterium]|nr:SUF system NifU family Fe-S cluster assembly protein [Actinomycetaceae bacterium]
MLPFDQLYQEVILEHAAAKHGRGDLDSMQATSHQTNPTCGDEVTLGVVLDGDVLQSLSWDGQGCSISQASLSMMTDLVVGKHCQQIEDLWSKFSQMMHSRGKEIPDDILDALEDAASLQGTSQFPNRVKCALLGWMALRDAIALASHSEGKSASGKATAPHC